MLHACHTYKSISGIAHYSQTSSLCHVIEDVLVRIKKKELKVDVCADLLFQSFDVLEASLKAVSQDKEELDTASLVKKLQTLATKDEGGGTKDEAARHPGESLEEPLLPEKIKSIEVKVERLDLLMCLSEELLIIRLGLERIKEILQNPELSSSVNTLDRLVSELQFNIMQSRTVPLNFVFNRFPRLVRDLAKDEKKEVNLEIGGGDIELDRSIVEALVEPMVHLVRNAIDHGIETPKEREGLKKPSQATLRLSAKRARGFAIIEISDDGRGLDWDEVKRQAIRLRLISAHQPEGRGLASDKPEGDGAASDKPAGNGAASDSRSHSHSRSHSQSHPVQEELVNALFSGLSTTKEVTQISGRGFGLNIVKQRIESLGGSVKVESQPSKGARFILEIPLTLAVFKVLFVKVGPKLYAISLANVERLIHVHKQDIKGMMNYEAIVFGDEDIPITRLNELFKLPRLDLNSQPIVIVKKEEDRLGLAVDELGETQEIVFKPLRIAREGKYFTGCTILGSGEVALILDVANLILSKRKLAASN